MKQDEIYTKLFNFSRPTFFKWKREKVPAMQLLLKYFTNEELEEFLEKGSISKCEDFKDYQIDPIFEDYVITNLKRIHKPSGSILSLFFNESDPYADCLKNIYLDDLTIKNAKNKLKDCLLFAKREKMSNKINDELRKREEENVIKEIDSEISNIETYLLLKNIKNTKD